MGRELTDSCMDKKDNGLKDLDGVRKDTSHIPSKISDDSSEAKDYEIKECTEEHSGQEPDVTINNFDVALHEVKDEKPGSQDSSPSSLKYPAARSSRPKHTIPKPFSLATEKRLSSVSRTAVSEFGGVMNGSANANMVRSPVASKNLQPSSPEANMRKLQSDKKHSTDEDDNWSLASSTAVSVRTNKSRVTIASAPKFRCYERVERRKEFYTKLEQKHRALEDEKTQSDQRMKEEQQAAIRQLRKNMVVKANPVPNFYYEPPPPKPQLKKLPLTRPKSPIFNRRRSCGDAINSPQEKEKCTRGYRHSLGSYKIESSPSPSSSVKNKSQVGGRRSTVSCKAKDPSKQEKGNAKMPSLSEISDNNITVHS